MGYLLRLAVTEHIIEWLPYRNSEPDGNKNFNKNNTNPPRKKSNHTIKCTNFTFVLRQGRYKHGPGGFRAVQPTPLQLIQIICLEQVLLHQTLCSAHNSSTSLYSTFQPNFAHSKVFYIPSNRGNVVTFIAQNHFFLRILLR
jgi:hypothetical protein